MHLNLQDVPGTLATIEALAVAKGYGKVFARIPLDAWQAFKAAGYLKEAVVPGFYRGRADGLFVARYFSSRRQAPPLPETMQQLQSIIDEKSTGTKAGKTTIRVVTCEPTDSAAMGNFYESVFRSYPFPIFDREYLRCMMAENVSYYCTRTGGLITALAAIEIDQESKTAEMTDFATHPEWRGRGLADALLKQMEKETRKLEIQTTYTIARAASPGINRLFKSNGYKYAGLLLNNSHISGSIQSMTVWYKKL
jgi:putative beta-lysine N-acetyltransferase